MLLYKNWSLWLSLKINSYHCDDFHISWMDIPCKHNTGSNHWSSLTVYHCNLCLCCNTIFLCCRHICVSSGILLKWNSLIDNISVDFDSLNIIHRLAYSLNQSIFTFLSRRCHPTLYAYVWASNKMLLHFAGTINQINTASLISSFPIDLVKTRVQRINISRHPQIIYFTRI